MIEITTKVRAKRELTIDGVQYLVTPPKAYLSLMLGVRSKTAGDDPTLLVETIDAWVVAAFGKNAPKIQKRLNDPADDLDLDDIMGIMEALAAADAGDPPT